MHALSSVDSASHQVDRSKQALRGICASTSLRFQSADPGSGAAAIGDSDAVDDRQRIIAHFVILLTSKFGGLTGRGNFWLEASGLGGVDGHAFGKRQVGGSTSVLGGVLPKCRRGRSQSPAGGAEDVGLPNM